MVQQVVEEREGPTCDGEAPALCFPEGIKIRDPSTRWVRDTCCAEVFEDLVWTLVVDM